LIALVEADVALALQLLLWFLCAGLLIVIIIILPHSFAVVAVQDTQVKFATNLYLSPPPPPPFSLSLFLAGSKESSTCVLLLWALRLRVCDFGSAVLGGLILSIRD
jgi:hypothetical protein